MIFFSRRVFRDILSNPFLNTVTIVTIALSILIVGAFMLFAVNVNEALSLWIKDMRIMAYMDPGISDDQRAALQEKIKKLPDVLDVRYISKEDALARFKTQLGPQAGLIGNLKENPLPASFEIRTTDMSDNWDALKISAQVIKKMPHITDVEYGREWLNRFADFFNLFKMAGYALGVLFFMAAVFFVANTIRLVLYSRRDEVEIMRLVGATESFIKMPFYLQSIIQGALGGAAGLGVLFIIFRFVSFNMVQKFTGGFIQLHFLSPDMLLKIMAGSITVGWMGCYISLKQFLKV